MEVGEARTIIEQRDSYGSHSGGGYDHCPEGIPVELALLSILGICLLAVVVFYICWVFSQVHPVQLYMSCIKQHEA